MRVTLLVAAIALCAAPVAPADMVSMPDQIELSGKKIEILEIRDKEVVVRVAYGEITVPRSRVTGMKVDFEGRLKRLKDEGIDTARALYKLGRVCAQLGQPKQATAAYREALARAPLAEDILLPMAADLEQAGAWAAAHKAYQAYLKLHPDNADAQAKARAAAAKAADMVPELEPVAVGGAEIQIAAGPVTAKPAVAEPAEPEPAEPGEPAEPEKPAEPEEPAEPAKPEKPAGPAVEEGLEARGGWTTEAWGSSAEISVGAAENSNDKMLRVWLAGAEKDKVNVMLGDEFDLSQKKAMTFDVYNFSKKRIDIAVAFINRPGWKFYESLPVSVLPTGDKPKAVRLDLTTNRFKTAETKWRHKSALENPDKIIKIYFLLYTDVTGEWVFFNNIKFDPPGLPGGGGAARPAEAAQAERLERVASFMLRNAQASVEKEDWEKAKRFLDRLAERYAATKLYQEKKAEIDALKAKVDAKVPQQPKPAEEGKPAEGAKPAEKPAAEPKPAVEPKPVEEPKPAVDPKPEAKPAEAPKPEAKPAADPPAAEPKPAGEPKPAEEPKPEAKPAPDPPPAKPAAGPAEAKPAAKKPAPEEW